MDIQVITQFISSVGFPMFVAIWLLLRLEKTEKRGQEILLELKMSIDKMCDRLNGRE